MLDSLKEFFLIPVRFLQHGTRLTYASLAVASIIGILYFKIMFRKRDGFDEHPTVDLRQRFEYLWFKWKVITLIVICLVGYLAAYHQLPGWFPSFFSPR